LQASAEAAVVAVALMAASIVQAELGQVDKVMTVDRTDTLLIMAHHFQAVVAVALVDLVKVHLAHLFLAAVALAPVLPSPEPA
jgi:hypothetical protein